MTGIRTYDDLVHALRARAEELGLSRENIDDIAGLPSGYASKILAKKHIKRMGALSLWLILPALGAQLCLIEDPESLRAYASQRVRRDETRVRPVRSRDISEASVAP
jgi:hypothetical protein